MSIPTPFMVGRVNLWLIEDDPLTLVDTGPNSGKALDELERALSEHGRRIEDLERIVVTHQHMDHTGLLAILARRSGAEVCALDVLAPFLARYTEHMDADDELAEELMLRHGIPPDVVSALRAVSSAFRGWGSRADVTRPLGDGELLEWAGRRMRVLHRPGHSPSDTLFHDEDRGLLIGGDHLIGNISSNPLISRPLGGRSGHAGGERPRALLAYLRSLRETAAMDGVALVLPGHGDDVEDHAGLVRERLALHERRARKIARLLSAGPRTAHEIAHALWGNVAVTQAYLTLCEVLGHLDLLTERGEVVEDDQDGVTSFAPAG